MEFSREQWVARLSWAGGMKYTIRRYRAFLSFERWIAILLCFVVGWFSKLWIMHPFILITRSYGQKNPWWDIQWISQSLWGSIIAFLAVTVFLYVIWLWIWGIIQFAAGIWLEKCLDKLKIVGKLNVHYLTDWRLRNLFHPFRRVTWLIQEVLKNNADIELESHERRLFELDMRYIEANWGVIKKYIWVLVFVGWSLSLWRFYGFASEIVNGTRAVNNIGIYLALSFQVFIHVCIISLAIACMGYVAYKIWSEYLMFLDETLYDKVFPVCKLTPRGSMSYMQQDYGETLENIDARLSRMEMAIDKLILLVRKTGKS